MTHVDETAWHADPWDDPDVTDALSLERRPRGSKVFKWVVWIALVTLMAAVVVGGAAGYWYTGQVNPTGTPGDPQTFTVNADDTLKSISDRLETDGLVDKAWVFRWYVDHHGGLEITPGYYQLRPADHMGNLLRVLRTPPSETYTKVTFPEGYTVVQIGSRLQQRVPRLIATDFDAATADGSVRSKYQPASVLSLEGMLFPDTYQVSNGESVRQVMQRMVALMERVGTQEGIDNSAEKVGLTPYEVLIVASIVEREARVDTDRAKIARVVLNRLFLGMPLQVDATLLYGQPAGSSQTALRDVDTPYNTYMHTGLPPTPIASPGRASIRAVLNPAPNPSLGDPICVGNPPGVPCFYLYYVIADEEGHHVFAATAAQHEANVAEARKKGLL